MKRLIQLINDIFYFEIPDNCKEQIKWELAGTNILRIRFFSVPIMFIMGALIIWDLNTLSIQLVEEHMILLVIHIIFLVSCFVFLLISLKTWKENQKDITIWNNLVINAYPGLVVFFCAVISFTFPYGAGAVTIFVLGCFGMAGIIYLRPRNTFIIYILSYLIFIIGQEYRGGEFYTHVANEINATVAIITAWFISALTYNTGIKDIIYRKTIEQLSFQDALTGIANRRQFDQVIVSEWHRAMRQGSFLSLGMCDIDFFKLYNDEYGHFAGDSCLIKVTETIKKELKRPSDMVARYGGEEFMILLPETDTEGAINTVNRIRVAVENMRIPHARSTISDHVTVSIGVTTVIPEKSKDMEAFLIQADRALYMAKEEGRNRVKALGGVCEKQNENLILIKQK